MIILGLILKISIPSKFLLMIGHDNACHYAWTFCLDLLSSHHQPKLRLPICFRLARTSSSLKTAGVQDPSKIPGETGLRWLSFYPQRRNHGFWLLVEPAAESVRRLQECREV